MFEKVIEYLEGEIRSLETSEGKAAYEKEKAEADKREEKIHPQNWRLFKKPSYDDYLQNRKSELAGYKQAESFATIIGVTEKSVTAKCEDGKERCIPIEEFALYSPVLGSRVAVNIAGSKAHLAIYRGLFVDVGIAAVLVSFEKRNAITYYSVVGNDPFTIPYSYFGTSDFDSFECGRSSIDMFCVDGEYYPAPSCLEKLRDARKTNPLVSLQETLEEILDAVQQDSGE